MSTKVKGISVTIMTENKGLNQRFFEGLTKDDVVWIQVTELLEPEGRGEIILTHHRESSVVASHTVASAQSGVNPTQPTEGGSTPKSPTRISEGWDWAGKAYHYYVDGRSLCRNWGFPNYKDMQPDSGNTELQRDDCKACMKALIKRRQKLGVTKIASLSDNSTGGKKQ